MLEGVWTAKIFTKQNGDRGVEILDSAPFDATHGLLPCYRLIGIKPSHQKLVLSISPRESVWGGGISPRHNGLGEIPYRTTPIPSGWLTTQVSGDLA